MMPAWLLVVRSVLCVLLASCGVLGASSLPMLLLLLVVSTLGFGSLFKHIHVGFCQQQ